MMIRIRPNVFLSRAGFFHFEMLRVSVARNAFVIYLPVINIQVQWGKLVPAKGEINYTLIESLRTGKSWQGGMPDSNSFHEGAKAMAEHLGYEVEGTIHTP